MELIEVRLKALDLAMDLGTSEILFGGQPAKIPATTLVEDARLIEAYILET